MKSIRNLVVGLVVVIAAALLAVPTFAQDNPTTPNAPSTGTSTVNTQHKPLGGLVSSMTLTITQQDINERIANRPGQALKDLSIVLGDNQITISFTTKGDATGGAGKALVAVVSPSVVDGKIDWKLVSLMVDGAPATPDQMTALKDRATRFVSGWFENRERRFNVTSITINSSAVTVSLVRNKTV
jgi:hypothetical protein